MFLSVFSLYLFLYYEIFIMTYEFVPSIPYAKAKSIRQTNACIFDRRFVAWTEANRCIRRFIYEFLKLQ